MNDDSIIIHILGLVVAVVFIFVVIVLASQLRNEFAEVFFRGVGDETFRLDEEDLGRLKEMVLVVAECRVDTRLRASCTLDHCTMTKTIFRFELHTLFFTFKVFLLIVVSMIGEDVNIVESLLIDVIVVSFQDDCGNLLFLHCASRTQKHDLRARFLKQNKGLGLGDDRLRHNGFGVGDVERGTRFGLGT